MRAATKERMISVTALVLVISNRFLICPASSAKTSSKMLIPGYRAVLPNAATA
jgi:hypothetical protein